jgi:phage tail-like protein
VADVIDPLVGFNFRLEVEKVPAGFFTEVAGLGSENDVVEQKTLDPAGHEVVIKVPGRLKWGDIVLKRGITNDMKIWQWRQEVIDGKMDKARANCSIIMQDRTYADVARWDFQNAWPSKVSGPTLKSDSSEFGIEELTLVHEGIARTS